MVFMYDHKAVFRTKNSQACGTIPRTATQLTPSPSFRSPAPGPRLGEDEAEEGLAASLPGDMPPGNEAWKRSFTRDAQAVWGVPFKSAIITTVMLSQPRLMAPDVDRHSSMMASHTPGRSKPAAIRLDTKFTASWFVNTSQMPIQRTHRLIRSHVEQFQTITALTYKALEDVTAFLPVLTTHVFK